jgi:hypothetical protein
MTISGKTKSLTFILYPYILNRRDGLRHSGTKNFTRAIYIAKITPVVKVQPSPYGTPYGAEGRDDGVKIVVFNNLHV